MRLINKQVVIEQALERRGLQAGDTIPVKRFKEGTDLKELVTWKQSNGQLVGEFVGAGDFDAAFFSQQRYEVNVGRDLEPLLYPFIYDVTVDATLPETFTIYATGPAGVVFEEVKADGGEVKFATVGESSKSVTIRQYAAGIQYSERLFRFNRQFQIARLARQFGVASNALMNHIHFAPLLDFSYGATNQTAAATTGSTQIEKYHNTLSAAITHSKADPTWPRRGPYTLVAASGNLSMVRKALSEVPQQGVQLHDPEVFSRITQVVEYDGWTGTRGKKSTTYSGVTTGKAYLVNQAHRDEDFQSYYQQELREQRGDADISRFILEETIYDVWFGLYASPRAAVEEITLPS